MTYVNLLKQIFTSRKTANEQQRVNMLIASCDLVFNESENLGDDWVKHLSPSGHREERAGAEPGAIDAPHFVTPLPESSVHH